MFTYINLETVLETDVNFVYTYVGSTWIALY